VASATHGGRAPTDSSVRARRRSGGFAPTAPGTGRKLCRVLSLLGLVKTRASPDTSQLLLAPTRLTQGPLRQLLLHGLLPGLPGDGNSAASGGTAAGWPSAPWLGNWLLQSCLTATWTLLGGWFKPRWHS
jgi:hypothetical protein